MRSTLPVEQVSGRCWFGCESGLAGQCGASLCAVTLLIVDVDGRFPEGVGLAWLPRTVWVADGVGVAEAGAVDGGGGVAEALAGVGDPGGAANGGGDGDAEGGGDGEAVPAATKLGVVEAAVAADDPEAVLELPCAGPGRCAIDPVEDAANTAVPSARSATSARIGTRPTRLPRGSGSRQLEQNPETGVVTNPQFRQRTGRRFRAMAWLVAFSMRDRF